MSISYASILSASIALFCSTASLFGQQANPMAMISDTEIAGSSELFTLQGEMDQTSTRVDQVSYTRTNCCDACSTPSCQSCCDSSGWLVETEILFLQYLKADGVRVGTGSPGEDINGDYEITPRITFGYVTTSGMGMRARWWMYDHEVGRGTNSNEIFAVDTYTIDAELFQRFNVNDYWALEVSGGLRYNNFEEVIDDGISINRQADFSGVGGIIGGELSREIRHGRLFSRLRLAMLADDKLILNDDSRDDPPRLGSTQGMVEMALGYEHRRILRNGSEIFARGFAEWQNWYNYSESLLENNNGDELNSGPTDSGFFGFGLSMGLFF